MKTLLDYSNSCRICLRPDLSGSGTTNVYNYTISGYQKPLAEIIFALFKIKWQMHSEFPSSMCRKCSIGMEQVLLFKEEIEQNQLLLSEIFKKANSSFSCATKLEPGSLKTSQVNVLGCVDVNADLGSKIIKGEQVTPKGRRRKWLNMSNNSLRRSSRLSKSVLSPIGNVKTQIKSEDVTPKKKMSQSRDMPGAGYSPMGLGTTPSSLSSEQDNPQVAFLQNLNLVTLQDAEILQKKGSHKQTGKGFIAKKFHDLNFPHIPKSNDKILRKCLSKKSTIRKKLHSRSSSSEFLDINRSLNFLCRYGFRKMNNSMQLRTKDVSASLSKIRFKVRNKRTPKTDRENRTNLFNVQNKRQNNRTVRNHQHSSKCLNPASSIVERSRGGTYMYRP